MIDGLTAYLFLRTFDSFNKIEKAHAQGQPSKLSKEEEEKETQSQILYDSN